MKRALLYCLVCFSQLLFAADKPWTEVRSQHFRVLTDGSEKDARKLALDFEQMRGVFELRFSHFRLDTGAPLLIFAAKDRESAEALNPAFHNQALLGLYHHGWEKQFAVIRLGDQALDGVKTVQHEYVHSILHMNTRWMPKWMDEGLAEYLGSARFDGDKVTLGIPSVRMNDIRNNFAHGSQLGALRRPLIPIQDMVSSNRGPDFSDPRSVSFFYAECWAIIHFMELGPGMEHGEKLNRFYTQLDQGVPQEKAFVQAFGDMNKFDNDLTTYLSGLTMPTVTLTDMQKFKENDFSTRTLSLAESASEIGGYQIWIRRLAAARPLLEQALKEDPKLALAHENMGFLRFGEGNDAEAAEEFSKAYELDPTRYLSLYYKAMLEQELAKPEDRPNLYPVCLQIVKINPQFAPAYVQLSLYHLKNGNLSNALLMAKKASELEPGRAGYFLLEAHIMTLMGQYADAADIASYVAQRWVGPDHDEAVAIWNRIPVAKRPAAENVAEIIPEGVHVVDGTIRSVACPDKDKGTKFELTLDQAGQPFHFHSTGGFTTGYSDTVWYGEDHFSRCEHMTGMHAVVRFNPATGPSYTGDLVELELRVDLPVPPPPETGSAASAAK